MDKNTKVNILITGHSGFIGSHAADYFLEQGHVIYGVARSSRPNCPYNQYIMNIDDCDSLSRLANEKCIDVIIHFAGKPIVADCDKDPFNAFKINGLGTASVLEAARYANVNKTLIIETDKVYGVQNEVPTKEDAILNPGSPYEFSKALASYLCDFYRKHYNMNVISVRPVNVYGPGDFSFTRIVPAAMRNIAEGKGIPVQEHAVKIQRNFIYVRDVVKMMHLLATHDTDHQVYNFSTNKSFSILEFATSITRALNHSVDPIIVKKPGKYPEIPLQSIDGARFNNEFDFVFTPFETAIQETYKEYCRLLSPASKR